MVVLISMSLLVGGCMRTGRELARKGDEIMVAGRLFHTGTPIVLWTDPGGYDAYRVERRFSQWEKSSWENTRVDGKEPDSPNRYGLRRAGLDDTTLAKVRGGGWDLETLRNQVDQFVLHYDVCGTSRDCFRVLHDARGLSVHFLLDIDGTIYQTLDVKERAWHAGIANDRSVGIEIANMGAYPVAAVPKSPLAGWYERDSTGTRIMIPQSKGDGGVRTKGFVGRPARDLPIVGEIHGHAYAMYDLTPEQYEALEKLTAALCIVLPELTCDYPRGEDGRVLPRVLTREELAAHSGLLAHWHITDNKIDPGPAFDWDRVVKGARRRMPVNRIHY